jgi:hypothetical protein
MIGRPKATVLVLLTLAAGGGALAFLAVSRFLPIFPDHPL